MIIVHPLQQRCSLRPYRRHQDLRFPWRSAIESWCAVAKHRRYGSCTGRSATRHSKQLRVPCLAPCQWLSSIEDPARWQTQGKAGGVHCEYCSIHACALQGTASPPCPSVLSTSTKDPFWRRVRKGRGARLQPEQHTVSPRPGPAPSTLCTRLAQPCSCMLPERIAIVAWRPDIWLGCRAASESSIAMAYRLADTLAAHGPAAAPGHRCGDAGKQPVPASAEEGLVLCCVYLAENLPQPDTQPTGGHTI